MGEEPRMKNLGSEGGMLKEWDVDYQSSQAGSKGLLGLSVAMKHWATPACELSPNWSQVLQWIIQLHPHKPKMKYCYFHFRATEVSGLQD